MSYHPGLGRFVQPDPIGFDAGDTNFFRYEGYNPVSAVDPFGLQEFRLNIWQQYANSKDIQVRFNVPPGQKCENGKGDIFVEFKHRGGNVYQIKCYGQMLRGELDLVHKRKLAGGVLVTQPQDVGRCPDEHGAGFNVWLFETESKTGTFKRITWISAGLETKDATGRRSKDEEIRANRVTVDNRINELRGKIKDPDKLEAAILAYLNSAREVETDRTTGKKMVRITGRWSAE